jgi:hypothetical protein
MIAVANLRRDRKNNSLLPLIISAITVRSNPALPWPG